MVAGKIHSKEGLIDWSILKWLWLGSFPSSVAVIILMRNGFLSFDTTFLINSIGVAILLTSFGMIFQEVLRRLGKNLRIKHSYAFKTWQPFLTICAGIFWVLQ
jgi:uncharacterized membrane protein YfcA